jgi:uncharacterized protein Usg
MDELCMNYSLLFSILMSTLGWSGNWLSSPLFRLSEALLLSALCVNCGVVAVLIAWSYGDSLKSWANFARLGWKSSGMASLFPSLRAFLKIWTSKIDEAAFWLRVNGIVPFRWSNAKETRVMDEQKRLLAIRKNLEKHIPRGFARIWAMLSLFIIAASWSGWAYLAVTDHREIMALKTELSRYRNDTVVEHHILFGSKLDDGDFSYTSDEEPQGGAFRPCQSDIANHLDVPGILSKAEGYYADFGAWEERGTCKSILRADIGFWFKDKNTKFHVVKGE